MVGGLAGIVLGVGASELIAIYAGWPVALSAGTDLHGLRLRGAHRHLFRLLSRPPGRGARPDRRPAFRVGEGPERLENPQLRLARHDFADLGGAVAGGGEGGEDRVDARFRDDEQEAARGLGIEDQVLFDLAAVADPLDVRRQVAAVGAGGPGGDAGLGDLEEARMGLERGEVDFER